VWIGFLFVNLVLVVDARIVPNINTVAKCLGMSDSLAGMTLLALGNGAADVFSAVAAVNASENGANLAISGLLGGGL
jgi:sodium/potassium/calcium exchanger 6